MNIYNQDGLFYIRILNWILGIKDLRKQRLYFSERNGYIKHLVVGNYSVCVKNM